MCRVDAQYGFRCRGYAGDMQGVCRGYAARMQGRCTGDACHCQWSRQCSVDSVKMQRVELQLEAGGVKMRCRMEVLRGHRGDAGKNNNESFRSDPLRYLLVDVVCMGIVD